ncbi:hypothetical protein WN943_016711 [Citrus x changshan-huyou]
MEVFMVAAECDGEVWRTRLLRRNPRKLPGASDEDIVSLMRIGDPVLWAEIGMNWEPDILCLNNTGRENTVCGFVMARLLEVSRCLGYGMHVLANELIVGLKHILKTMNPRFLLCHFLSEWGNLWCSVESLSIQSGHPLFHLNLSPSVQSNRLLSTREVLVEHAKAISMRLSFTQLRQHQMHVVAPSFVPYMAPAPSPIHQASIATPGIDPLPRRHRGGHHHHHSKPHAVTPASSVRPGNILIVVPFEGVVAPLWLSSPIMLYQQVVQKEWDPAGHANCKGDIN